MVKQISHEVHKNSGFTFTRREGIIGSAVLAAGVFAGTKLGGGDSPRQGNNLAPAPAEQGEVAEQPQQVESLAISEITRDPAVYEGRLTPEEIYEAFEQSEDALKEVLQITTDMVGSPDDYPPAFATGL